MCGLRTLRKARAIEKVVEKILTKARENRDQLRLQGVPKSLEKDTSPTKEKERGKARVENLAKRRVKENVSQNGQKMKSMVDGQWSEPETVSES